MNHSKDIVVGDNVWIASHVTLLGGAGIGTGSVVGTNAVTSSSFVKHCCLPEITPSVYLKGIGQNISCYFVHPRIFHLSEPLSWIPGGKAYELLFREKQGAV